MQPINNKNKEHKKEHIIMKRFIKIPTVVFELDLTPLQLLVYAGIISLKSKENYTVATAETISKRCHISKNSVYTAVNTLETFGLVNKTNNIKNGKNVANSYFISNIGGNFVKLDYSIFKFKLSPSQFAAYIAIKSKCNQANYSFPSLKQISELAHICIDTVISSVKFLCNKGLLILKHYIRVCGCFGHNNYIVFDNPAENENTENKILQPKTSFRGTVCKKVASLFLRKLRYSKFWATLLDPFKNIPKREKKISNLFNTIRKLRV